MNAIVKLEPEALVAFVRGIEISEARNLFVPRNPVSSAAAYVCMGSLCCFTPTVTAQHKRDVLDSMLFAQAAASHDYDRENDTQNWYHRYREVLEKIGWAINGFEFDQVDTGSSTFSVDETVLDLIMAIASQDEDAILQQTLDSLRKLKNSDDRIVLWEQSSHSEHHANFQVSTAKEDGTGNVTMALAASHFDSNSRCTSVLWFHYSSNDTHFYRGAQRVTLDDAVYRTVRPLVREKVRELAIRTVKSIDI